MLIVDKVEKSYNKGGRLSGNRQQVLHNISFECRYGECLGIIGESGSGKSTLGRLLLGIEKPDRGTILLDGGAIRDRKTRLKKISAVFQDYSSSLHPFYTVEQTMLEPLKLLGKPEKDVQYRVNALLYQVGLDPSYRNKYPHELSGGEAQRVCIARAVSIEPKYVLMDEAVSSLDGSIQLQVLEMLKDLRKIYGMSYIFITHDIQAAAYICDRVMIVRNGCIEECVATKQLKDVKSEYATTLLKKMII